MKPLVHLPIDFEQRDDVRTLARVLKQRDAIGHVAALCVFRLWLEWGRVGAAWRPLQQARPAGVRDWEKENLAHLIAECCQYVGFPQSLMEYLIESGVLTVVAQGELDGLVLNDFAACNPHLLPGHESIHSKGARIMHEKRRAAETAELAAQQVRVIEQQGLNLFPATAQVTEEETKKCLALVMTLDSLCGRAMRTSGEYVADENLMRDALHVLRGHTWDNIVLVQRYIRAQRDNPAVVKDTAAILRGFDVLLGKAKQ